MLTFEVKAWPFVLGCTYVMSSCCFACCFGSFPLSSRLDILKLIKMNDSAVDAAIDKTHLRTTKRIVPHVKRQHLLSNRSRPSTRQDRRTHTVMIHSATTIQSSPIIATPFRWTFLSKATTVAPGKARHVTVQTHSPPTS